MRVLILGGTGFIGAHVVKELVAKGRQVTVVHRGRSSTQVPDGASSIIFDRRELSDFAPQLRKIAPDAIIDMIPRTAQEIWALTKALSGASSRLIVVSSIDVYRAYNRLRKREPGSPDPTPLRECAPLREQLFPYRGNAVDALHTAYEYEKIIVEKLAEGQTDLPSTILRLPVVYGPRDPQLRIFEYLRRMDDGRSTIILGKQQSKWQLTRSYVDDVAKAIALTITDTSKENRLYNLGERESLSELEWVKQIGQAASWKGEVVTMDEEALPKHLSQDYDWRQHLTIDSEPFRQEYNWNETVSREEALKLTVDWQRQNPPETVDLDKFDYEAEDEILETKLKLAKR